MVLVEKQNPTLDNKRASRDEVAEEAGAIAADIPQEFLIKHPLQSEWTLWHLESNRSKSWEELLNEITSFETAEDFWSLYNHLKLPSDIKSGSDYSLFKKGVRPMWEDDANKRGGRWVLAMSKQHRRTDLDNLWLDVLLCMIGETFEHSADICGAVVNVRAKMNKISIWTADYSDEESVLEIGQKLKDSLRLTNEKLVYQPHIEAMSNTTGPVKALYTL